MTDTRTRILEAALLLFGNQGYTETGMREIAKRVEIKAPSIYKHFPSKEAILEELLKKYGPSRITQKLEAIEETEDTEKLIDSLLELAAIMFKDSRDNLVMRILLGESLRNPDVANLLQEIFFTKQRSAFVALFTRLIDKKVIAETNPELLADTILAFGLYNRYAILTNSDPRKQKDLETRIAEQVLYFWKGLLLSEK